MYIYIYIYLYIYFNRKTQIEITIPKHPIRRTLKHTDVHLLLRPGSWHLLDLKRTGKEMVLTVYNDSSWTTSSIKLWLNKTMASSLTIQNRSKTVLYLLGCTLQTALGSRLCSNTWCKKHQMIPACNDRLVACNACNQLWTWQLQTNIHDKNRCTFRRIMSITQKGGHLYIYTPCWHSHWPTVWLFCSKSWMCKMRSRTIRIKCVAYKMGYTVCMYVCMYVCM